MTDQIDTTVEEWRQVPGWEGWYSVSNWGRVRRDCKGSRTHPNKIRTMCFDTYGYYRISLYKNRNHKGFLIHQLVMLAFVGPRPEGMVVNHIDFDRTNNRLKNLEYVTIAQNNYHSRHRITEKIKRGEQHHWTILTTNQVLEIRKLVRDGSSQSEMAKKYGMSQAMISKIVLRKSWKHI